MMNGVKVGQVNPIAWNAVSSMVN